MKLTLTDIGIVADEAGNVSLRLIDDDGGEHIALVPAAWINKLAVRLQESVIKATGPTSGIYPHLPTYPVTNARLMHNPETTEIGVSTEETGWIVLGCSDNLLRHLKTLIDQALIHRTARKSRQ